MAKVHREQTKKMMTNVQTPTPPRRVGRPKVRPLGAKRREVGWLTDEQYEVIARYGNGNFSEAIRLIAEQLKETPNEEWLTLVRPVQGN